MTSMEPVQILLVDDRPENLLALEAVLEGRGYRLVKAGSGRQALKLLLEQHFALVLLDVSMPDLSGFDVAELIRSRHRTRHTPIIFITANSKSVSQVFRGYSVGAVDYLFKPFSPEVLVSKVDVFVDLYRKSCALEEQAEALRRAHDELEARVRARTAELANANEMLSAEIAERRRIESERAELFEREQRARLEAEASNRAKDQFLATLSHELRTPLNAILGWAHMLEAGQLDADASRRAVAIIRNNAAIQRQLIDDILDVSRIVSGRMSLEIRPVAPREVIELALDAVRPAAEARQTTIAARLDEGPPIMADRDRLQQIVWNLLSNAVKFTPKGGRIEVELERPDQELRLVVRDNGQGIEPEFLPHVFERFTQADSSVSRRHGGLGLGMAIVRHLVELHGGTVSVASEGTNKGSRFTVTLPARAAEAGDETADIEGAARSRGKPSLHGLSILVVDDEPDAREYAEIVLRQAGADVRTADSADEAWRAIETRTPDIVVSDIGMPGEDGLRLMRRIRQRPPGEGGRVPAVALTAYTSAADEHEARQAGFQAHLRKPVDELTLLRAVAAVARPPEDGREGLTH